MAIRRRFLRVLGKDPREVNYKWFVSVTQAHILEVSWCNLSRLYPDRLSILVSLWEGMKYMEFLSGSVEKELIFSCCFSYYN
jgi:hypothetical protein